jgi:hypothetical protein
MEELEKAPKELKRSATL